MSFAIDWTSFLIASISLLILYSALKLRRKETEPYLLYSSLSQLNKYGPGFKASLNHLPKSLKIVSLIFFIIAFIDPHLVSVRGEKDQRRPLYTEGSAIYFVLDNSGSMQRKVVHTQSKDTISFGTKLDVLKKFTGEFINKRPSDLIGLITFARGANVISPLTIEHDSTLNSLEEVEVIDDEKFDGTAIGYAIYKTASVISATKHYAKEVLSDKYPVYDIKGSVMILVTDGFQNPHPDDKGKKLRTINIDEAADYARNQGVRLYIISIDPAINSKEFVPHRNLLQRSAEKTGGKFYSTDDAGKIKEIYDDIDTLEKSIVPIVNYQADQQIFLLRGKSFYPMLIFAGMLVLLFAIVLETLYFRRVP